MVDRLNQELKGLGRPRAAKENAGSWGHCSLPGGATMEARLAHDYARWSKIASDKGISAQ